MLLPRPAVAVLPGRCSKRSFPHRRRPVSGPSWRASWSRTPSLALHEAVGFRRVGIQHGMGQDARGRWRDVVLLERRSRAVGR